MKPELPKAYSAADWGGRDTGPCLHQTDDVLAYGAACAAHERERINAEHAQRLLDAERGASDAKRWEWWRARTCAHRVGRDGQEFGFPVRGATGTRNLMQGSVAQHLDDEVDAAIRAGEPS